MQYWKLIVLLQVFHSLVHHDKGSNLVISQEILYNCLFVQFLRFWIVNLTVEIKLEEPMQVLKEKEKKFYVWCKWETVEEVFFNSYTTFSFFATQLFSHLSQHFWCFQQCCFAKKKVVVVQESLTTYCTSCKIFFVMSLIGFQKVIRILLFIVHKMWYTKNRFF